jgi:thymidylate synthase
MEFPILHVPARNLSYDFMYREAWWILSGNNRTDLLTKYAPSMMKFSDDGWRLNGAYGPKIVDQMSYVLETLGNDPSSRQAVINIWRERPGSSKDIPCTLSVQFLIRDKHLHMVVTMRSSDIWLGLPYDVFTFTMLACQLGIELNKDWGMELSLGTCYHNAGSRHVYMSDWEKINSVNNQLLHNPDWTNGPSVGLKQMVEVFDSGFKLQQALYNRSTNKLIPKLQWLSM